MLYLCRDVSYIQNDFLHVELISVYRVYQNAQLGRERQTERVTDYPLV